jgi:hypothetical protein
MLRSLILALSLVLASSFPAAAQTGPVSNTTTAQPILAANAQSVTPERLVGYLRHKGHAAEVQKLNNGVQIVTARIQKDNWTYEAQFEFSANGKNVNLICQLANAQNYSRAQLFDLLKRNYDFGGLRHFSIRANDQRLCLEDNNYSTANMSDAILETTVNNFLQLVRDTHPLWGNPAGQTGIAQN